MITDHVSPNANARPAGTRIDAIVLHADAGTTDGGTVSWCCAAVSKVSYHYLIGRAGVIWRLVSDEHRAWHAGRSVWLGRTDVNDFSLGVAFANDQLGEPFQVAALQAGVDLVVALCQRHDIPVARIVTHAACATPPGRKRDPGPLFPFATFLADVETRLAA